MAILLARVDDRLIHGQVVVGWGSALHADLVLVCSDELAHSSWEKELLLSGVNEEMDAEVLSVVQTVEFMAQVAPGRGVFLLAETPDVFLQLVRKGAQIDKLNLGGMHHGKGKKRVTDYVYVDDHDVSVLSELLRLGVRLEAQDLPGSKPVDVGKKLRLGT